MGGGQNCIWGEFIPVPDCAGEEGVASVVCAAAEALVFEAVVAASCTHIVQELCESRGGRPGLSVLMSLLVSVDVKLY